MRLEANSTHAAPVGSIAGFAICERHEGRAAERVSAAINRAMQHSPWLNHRDLHVGRSWIKLWGHGELESKMCRTPGRGLTFLVGRPHSVVSPEAIRTHLPGERSLPWEGRLVAVHVTDHGEWLIRNDWTGSIPVYYGNTHTAVLSSLEPAVSAGLDLSFDDATPAGIVSLLTHGYYVGTRTLFRGMHAVGADSLISWDGTAFREHAARSITPNDDRWGCGWDDLVLECADRTLAALEQALRTQAEWTLPLSSGLDSRLIGIAASRLGMKPNSVTFGQPGWLDPVIARRVARVLGFPWKFVELGEEYLMQWTRYWSDWFGSSMHFHGMYHMPLLADLGLYGPSTAVGYAGDPLGGAQTALLSRECGSVRDRFVNKWQMWKDSELSTLLRFDPTDALAELEVEFEAQAATHQGAGFQKLWMLYQYNHTARFISYHPSLHDTWCGAITPFVDRSLAEFTVSLPRAALDGRRLQIAALRKLHPRLATISGSFGGEPAAPSGMHYLRRTLADILPRTAIRGPLREFAPTENLADQNALRRHGRRAVWPLNQATRQLADTLDLKVLTAVERQAANGDLSAFARLQAVQPLAWLSQRSESLPTGENA